MGRGRAVREEGSWKVLQGDGNNEEEGWGAARKRGGSRVPRNRARVPLAGGGPVPLAAHASSNTASWPAPAIKTLPPLALGGMDGDALTH
jgi:hypothetical protein